MATAWERCFGFLFPPDSGRWINVLRVGLGLQVSLYAWSLRHDWLYLFGTAKRGLVNRALAEAVLAGESLFTPRLGWLIAAGRLVGLTEAPVLWLSWLTLLVAGLFLLSGVCFRPAAIAAWFLYLSSAKSGTLFAYGVDNFTVIGLFYLMIAPGPHRMIFRLRRSRRAAASPERYGFHRRILQLHLCVIYLFGGLSKCLGPEWWNGNSIWRALTRPPFDVISPDLLIHFQAFFPLLGILVLLLETGYPVFIWIRRTRPLWLISILLMHLLIGLTMGLYLFAMIMITLNLAAFGTELFPTLLPVSVRPEPIRDDTV